MDTENEKMKKTAKQIVDLRTVKVTIGSLKIHSLGDQVKPKISEISSQRQSLQLEMC